VKIGTQDKKKVIVMAVLMVIAIPLALHNFDFGGSSTPPSTNVPATTTTTSAPAQKKGPKIRENSLDPTLRTDILMASQKVEYAGGSRNIFRVYEAPIPIPKPSDNVRVNTPPLIPQDPPKPQIPLVFYGFSNRPGEPKKAFLKEGDNIFVAVEGEVVERRYKIVKIVTGTNSFILVQDILNNNQQTINLTLPQAGGSPGL
jgi:hypothetical protein